MTLRGARRALAVAAAMAVLGPRAGGQSLPIPGDGFAPGWRQAGPPRTFVKLDLFNHIDGGAELFLEFGFTRLAVQEYRRGEVPLVLNAYEMDGPEAALGIYLMKAGRETPFPGVRARNSSEDAQITAVKGRYFVQADNFEAGAAARPALVALANAFLAGVRGEAPRPLLEKLPRLGLFIGSERLLRGPVALQSFFTFGEGDILGLEGRIFAALGDYKDPDGRPYSRIVVDYGTASAAAAAYERLVSNLDPYLTVVASAPDGFSFQDFQKLYGRAERRGSVLEIRFKSPRPF